MQRQLSKEDFAEEVDWRHNRCFVCKKRFIESIGASVVSIRKSIVDTTPPSCKPWEILFSPTYTGYFCQQGAGRSSGEDCLYIHEQCFFDAAGDDWKF